MKGKRKVQRDDSSAYLRAPKPPRVTGGMRPTREFTLAARRYAGWFAALGVAWWALHSFMLQADAFRLSADKGSLSIVGVALGYEDEVSAVFDADLGHSLAAINVADRRRQLRSLPWVRDARVSKVWPDALKVVVEERVPVALLSISGMKLVRMIDAYGAILDHRGEGGESLPVLTGIDAGMDLAERRERVKLYQAVMEAFARRGRGLPNEVSEVNVADLKNAVVVAKHAGQIVKLQMGDRNLPHRLEVFLNYFDAWQSEFGTLEAVDLRFDKQVAIQPQPGTEKKG